jgi:hypothetical protein
MVPKAPLNMQRGVMDIDWGGLKIIGFFGLIMAVVAYDIIKTRREIAADKRAAAAAPRIPEPKL